jgi:hypothetical protein
VTNSELIAKLQQNDPDGEVLIFISEDGIDAWYTVGEVTEGPDTTYIDVGEVSCVGSSS